MVVNDEIETLLNRMSSDNGIEVNIKIANQILDKIEGYFDLVKSKLKPSELSAYNFSLSIIYSMSTGLTKDGFLVVLTRHIRNINSVFRAAKFRI